MEILNEIRKLPLNEQRSLADSLDRQLPADSEELERREREFESEMLAKGVFSSIPAQPMTDEEFFDDFELLEINGEPLSEQIILERR